MSLLVSDVMNPEIFHLRAGDSAEDALHGLLAFGIAGAPVLDEEGRPIGMVSLRELAAGNVSALDLLRALLGLPASHPAPFPHLDRAPDLAWTDPVPLELSALDAIPEGPGLIALLHNAAGRDHIVWTEAAHDVYTRLTDMISTPQTEWPLLASWLARGGLRFRAARLDAPSKGPEALAALHRLLGQA